MNNEFKLKDDLYTWLRSIYPGEIICDSKEVIQFFKIQFYLPGKRLAIGFERLRDNSYGPLKKKKVSRLRSGLKDNVNHLLFKTELCNLKDIMLFRIFEHEWSDPVKQKIWKSKIKLFLDQSDQVINIENCLIREMYPNEDKVVKVFLEKNHLDGFVESNLNLGVFHDGVLFMLWTFKNNILMRYTIKLNTKVINGFKYMLNYYKIKYNQDLFYIVNRRWTNINVSKDKIVYITSPNVLYYKPTKKVEKTKLIPRNKVFNQLTIFLDDDLTLDENMYANGYRKIYDCGYVVYKF